MIVLAKRQIRLVQKRGKVYFEGRWKLVHRDKYGNIIDIVEFDNLVTKQGMDYMLNAALHGSTAISAWYFAPHVSSDYTPSGDDTYASHGYTEATDQYQESNRQEWQEGEASNQAITNATAGVITAASSTTFYGIAIVGGGSDANKKGDTSGGGTLLSVGNLSSSKSLETDETLSMTYTISCSSS